MYATQRNSTTRAEGIALGVIATGAISVAIVAVVAIVQRAFAVFGADVTVPLPVTGGDVTVLDGVPGINDAQYTSADVTFATVPAGTSWMLFLEGALPALATIGVCGVTWWLGVSLLRARPFRRAMSVAIGVAACLVIAGGILGQLFGAIGRAILVEQLVEVQAAGDAAVSETFWTFLLQVDLAPFGWGLALALIAASFEIGARLQRETEGLV
ncbi:hypothetical protein [Microbacterium sp. LWS13-1.2]|uniref:DUF2975 domain-containing protein n=1 Tax=Microbacterium sp. LWS13-1.2 TaxID=3135264 RepID=A0AAU6SE57_9MICO